MSETPSTPPPAPSAAPVEYASGVPVAPGPGSLSQKDANLWGMLCHLAALSGFIGIPLGNVLGPLIVWMIKKNDSPFVDDQGKESLNFQITVLIALVVSFVLIFVVIGFLLIFAVGITALVFTIIGAVKANKGIAYRYPFALRLIK